MKIVRTVTEHVRVETRTQNVATTCDFCSRRITHGRFDLSEVTIEAVIGPVFPECDNRMKAKADCCVACWNEKVRPALEALLKKPMLEWPNHDIEPTINTAELPDNALQATTK
jgi:hypothetical protein